MFRDLKKLPNDFKYVFLKGDKENPIIINAFSQQEQEDKLIALLATKYDTIT